MNTQQLDTLLSSVLLPLTLILLADTLGYVLSATITAAVTTPFAPRNIAVQIFPPAVYTALSRWIVPPLVASGIRHAATLRRRL